MATIGNLFVNIGASTRGLDQGAKKATDTVKRMRSEIDGALSSLPGGERLAGPLRAVSEFIKKISGDSKGMRNALANIAQMEGQVASKVDAHAKAQRDLAMAQQYTQMLSKRSAMDEPLKRATAAMNKHVDAVRSYDAKINRATFRGAAYNAMLRKQEQNMARLAGVEREVNRRRAESAASDRKIGMMRGLLERRGVGIRADGGVDMAGLQAAAKNSGAAVEALRERIAAARNGLKQFAALPVTSAMGLTVLAAGAVAALGALAGFTLAVAKNASVLYDQAAALGISVSKYQNLRDQFTELGVAPGAAETAMQRLQVELQNAVEGSDEAIKKFQRLGMDIQSLASMDTADALIAILERTRALGTQGEKLKTLRDLFGRGGMGMAAAVNATAEELAHAREVADSLRIPDSIVQQLDESNDSAHAMFRAFENVAMVAAAQLAPIMDLVTRSLRELLTADLAGLANGFKVVALMVAPIVDLLRMAAANLRLAFNLAQAVAGVVVGVLAGGFAAIAAIIGYIVRGFEYMTGAGNDLSSAIIDVAKTSQQVAKEAFSGAGADLMEGLDAVVSQEFGAATKAVIETIGQDWDRATSKMVSEPIALTAKVDEESLKKIEEQLQALRDKLATFDMSEAQKAVYDLQKLNASPEQLAEAKRLAEALEAKEKQKKVEEDISNIMRDLQEQADTALMTEEQKLQYKLKQLGASEEELAKARALQAAIKERGELLKAQEDSAKTLQDMRDKLRKQQIGEDAFAREQFAKGATRDQLAEYDRLAAAIKAGEPVEPVTDTFSTAFGSLKLAGDVQDRMLTEQEKQTDLLRQIATEPLMLDISRVASVDGGEGSPTGVRASGMTDLLAQANGYLGDIARNTSAFAGALN